MAVFQVVGSYSDVPARYVSGITDIELVLSGGDWLVYTTTRAGGGMLAYARTAAGLTLLDTQQLDPSEALSTPAKMDQVMLNGQACILLAGYDCATLSGFSLTDSGRYGAALTEDSHASGLVVAQAMATVEGQCFLYSNRMGSDVIAAYCIGLDGRPIWVKDAHLPEPMQGIDIAAMQTVSLAGGSYLLTVSNSSDALRSYKILSDGSLMEVATLGAGGGLGIAAPAALSMVEMNGQTYALIAAAGSSSLSVVAVEGQGRMNLIDHVIDTRDTRFQGASVLASVTVAGRPYILVGGGDDGISLLTLLPNGRLLHLDNLLKQDGFPLDNLTALSARLIDGKIEVFAAGEGPGLMRFTVELGPLASPILGTAVADSLAGGAAGDLLSGGLGNDVLRGNDGDDILMDGDGADTLYGGAGADSFVMAADGMADVIQGFQPGLDIVDLTGWGRIYSTAALTFKALKGGHIRITWGVESLTLYSADGTVLTAAMFKSNDLFRLWHVVGDPVYEGLRLEGTSGADTQIGNSGEDTLVASAGADQMDGRAGFDLVDYSGDANGLVIDLELLHQAGDMAAGDELIGIEGLIGGMGDDRLIGTAEANLLRGNSGHDILIGRAGNDTLLGGAGDDSLQGGSGADRLQGGVGRDLASYDSSSGAVQADLVAQNQNAGAAAGDSFAEIEDLRGSDFADTLGGDPGGNALWGQAGDDLLIGRAGDDSLFGGDGDDRLWGDGGNDRLIGGAGIDTLIYQGTAPVRIDLTLTGEQATGQGLDWIEGFEWLATGTGDDWLMGSEIANRLSSGEGNDSLFGGMGDDTLDGGAGDDLIDGGDGIDWLEMTGRLGVTLNLALTAVQDTGLGMDLILGIEHVQVGEGDDRIRGDLQANTLISGAGNDQLFGNGGADQLFAGAGDDSLNGGAGNDRLDGGAGRDCAYFDGPAAMRIDLRSGLAVSTMAVTTDSLRNVEDIATSTGNDRIVGDGLDNAFLAGGGADTLIGGAGDDRLFGDEGNDFILADSGNDLIQGGAGQDWLDLGAARRGVQVNLGQAGLQVTGLGRDLISGIEHVKGSAGRDQIIGNVVANQVLGQGGADRLSGGGGADRLLGGAGNDRLDGGAGADRLDGGAGNDLLAGGAGADQFIFGGGRDRISDFSLHAQDRILIERALLGTWSDRSETDILHHFAHQTRHGMVLDLPGTARLIIDDLQGWHQLQTAVILV